MSGGSGGAGEGPLRALIVAYAFPPVGGAGVQRVAKWTKFLGEHGVVASVLTASNPSVPVVDPTLLRDVPPATRVVRVPTLEPGYAAKQAVWQGAAAARGRRGAQDVARQRRGEGDAAGEFGERGERGERGAGDASDARGACAVAGAGDARGEHEPRDARGEHEPRDARGEHEPRDARGERAARGVAATASRALARAAREALVPDAQVLWQPAAQAALARELATRGVDAVVISGPPFSQFLLAPTARLARGVGVVLDYRDEWSTMRGGHEMTPTLSRAASEALERVLVGAAHVVTTATGAFREALLRRFSWLDPDAVRVVPNGYDLDDLPRDLPGPTGERVSITYAGTVFRLTSPAGLFGALRRLHERSPAVARRLAVRFVGRVVETEAALFDGMGALGVERQGYVEHARAVRAVAASHAALCLLDEVPGAERVYPAKIFELMGLGRPCLALAPEGELARLVRAHGLGEVVPPRDEAAIAAALARMVDRFDRGEAPLVATPSGVERYDRRALAGELADALRDAKRRARAERPTA